MGEVFHGWRRKTGSATLVMACIVTAMWVSSSFRGFFLQIPQEPVLHNFLNAPCGLAYIKEEETIGAKNVLRFKSVASGFPIEEADFEWPQEITGLQDRRSWTRFGFHIEEGYEVIPTGGRLLKKIWLIPYWSVTVPLTLISAYLLLSKPRKAKSGPTHI